MISISHTCRRWAVAQHALTVRRTESLCWKNARSIQPAPSLLRHSLHPERLGSAVVGGGVVSTCYALPTARCAPMSDRIAVQQPPPADRHSRIHWVRRHDRRSASLIDHSSIRRATFPTARLSVAPAWCTTTRASIIACPIMCACPCPCPCACACTCPCPCMCV